MHQSRNHRLRSLQFVGSKSNGARGVIVVPREWPNVVHGLPRRTAIMYRWKPNPTAYHREGPHKVWVTRQVFAIVEECWCLMVRGWCLAKRGTICHAQRYIQIQGLFATICCIAKHNGNFTGVPGDAKLVNLVGGSITPSYAFWVSVVLHDIASLCRHPSEPIFWVRIGLLHRQLRLQAGVTVHPHHVVVRSRQATWHVDS